jgi:hypothetical protein
VISLSILQKYRKMRVGDNIGIKTPLGPIYAIITAYKNGIVSFAVDKNTSYTFNLRETWIDIRILKENTYIFKRHQNQKSIKLPIITPGALAFWKGDIVKGEVPTFIEIENHFYKTKI